MRTRIDFDLEDIQRAAQLRRIGRDLHDQAAAMSADTVEAMAAVVSRLESASDYGKVIRQGFSEAMIADAAARHITSI